MSRIHVNRFNRIKWAVMGAVVFAGLGVAVASPGEDGFPGKDRDPEFILKFDKNKDGKLDESERTALREEMKSRHAQHRQEMLQTYDKDGNGQLDDAERMAMRQERTAEKFKALDTDKNGQLSLAEFQAGAEHMGPRFHGRHGPGVK